MKLDKNAVDKIAAMPDQALWTMIQALGASGGFDLSAVKVTPAQLEKIRTAMTQMTDDDIGRAVEILQNCGGK